LAQWILDGQLNVRLQVQLHKLLWGDEKGKWRKSGFLCFFLLLDSYFSSLRLGFANLVLYFLTSVSMVSILSGLLPLKAYSVSQ
jgi:hypothetical protein